MNRAFGPELGIAERQRQWIWMEMVEATRTKATTKKVPFSVSRISKRRLGGAAHP